MWAYSPPPHPLPHLKKKTQTSRFLKGKNLPSHFQYDVKRSQKEESCSIFHTCCAPPPAFPEIPYPPNGHTSSPRLRKMMQWGTMWVERGNLTKVGSNQNFISALLFAKVITFEHQHAHNVCSPPTKFSSTHLPGHICNSHKTRYKATSLMRASLYM